jgi:hypothetical protein
MIFSFLSPFLIIYVPVILEFYFAGFPAFHINIFHLNLTQRLMPGFDSVKAERP